MSKIDNIYASLDDFGLITSKEAAAIGVSNAELVQIADRGKLTRVARGLYRATAWPYQEALPYAIAVKSAGDQAYLYGESVIALLNLVPTDPRKIQVATPIRNRKSLGDGINIIKTSSDNETEYFEGIKSQNLVDAILASAKTMGSERALQATNEANTQGYLTKDEANILIKEIQAL
jgi:predicted transcriptional regulator of viral defense system